MKSALIILATVLIFAGASVAAVRLADAASPSPKASSTAAKPCDLRAISLFGYIKSLSRTGDHFELRFDPALVLTGVTATRAALEDTGFGDVPNDSYVVQESDRVYTYLVPATAQVTVLTRSGRPDFGQTRISVSQLAQLVKGERPVKLFEPVETGFWMRFYNDTACSLDQQYHP